MTRNAWFPWLGMLLVLVLLSGCAGMATERLADSLSRAMLNQDDPATVRTGAAAYLLLIDGLIEDSPNDSLLLSAGARLYSAYAAGLVVEDYRSKLLTARGWEYGRRALCTRCGRLCDVEKQPFDHFAEQVAQVKSRSLRELYAYGTSWASWIQVRSDDWAALVDLAKVERVMERVIELDPAHDRGRAQLYLAVMRTQLPPALGGRPERGRVHFERAVEYSAGRDLMAKVEFARRYARLVFDKELHDRLLQEVLSADPHEPQLTLSNVLAQELARRLLAEEYF